MYLQIRIESEAVGFNIRLMTVRSVPAVCCQMRCHVLGKIDQISVRTGDGHGGMRCHLFDFVLICVEYYDGKGVRLICRQND